MSSPHLSPPAEADRELGPKESRRGVRSVIGPLLPGIAVCAAGGVLSLLLAQVLPGMSPLLLAILLGTLLANVFPLTPALAPGIGFTSKKLLRIGIAILGFQLVIMDI